jgi:hypothetical protein
MAAFTDARGCLTDAGLHALESAPLGRVPAELSSHLAACAGCQERLLRRGAGASSRRAARPRPPAWRMILVLAMAMLLTVSALIAARWLGR